MCYKLMVVIVIRVVPIYCILAVFHFTRNLYNLGGGVFFGLSFWLENEIDLSVCLGLEKQTQPQPTCDRAGGRRMGKMM